MTNKSTIDRHYIGANHPYAWITVAYPTPANTQYYFFVKWFSFKIKSHYCDMGLVKWIFHNLLPVEYDGLC